MAEITRKETLEVGNMDQKQAPERNVGSWTTDAEGAQPGDPPAGWSGGGGDHKVHPQELEAIRKRKDTKHLGDVRKAKGPSSTTKAASTASSNRLAIEALAARRELLQSLLFFQLERTQHI